MAAEARQKGHGAALVDTCCQWLVELGAEVVFVSTLEGAAMHRALAGASAIRRGYVKIPLGLLQRGRNARHSISLLQFQ